MHEKVKVKSTSWGGNVRARATECEGRDKGERVESKGDFAMWNE